MFIQYVLMYDLQRIFKIRKIDNILDKDEIKTLYDKLFEILSYVDEQVILGQVSIPVALQAHIILMKRHGWDYLNDTINVNVNFKLNSIFIDNFYFLNESEVKIDGILTNFIKDDEIIAQIDGVDVPTNIIYYPQRDNYSLNFNYGFNHCFNVVLPIKIGSKISFKTQNSKLDICYNQTSRLNDISKFLVSSNHIAIVNGDEILIADKKVHFALKLEIKTLTQMIKNHVQGWVTGVFLRVLYILSYPIYGKKRIWIFMDLPTVAGDNGLELFKYVNSIKNNNVKSYFVLEKSLEDEYNYLNSSKLYKLKRLLGLNKGNEQFSEIQGIGKVLPYQSLKHRLYMLFSEFIITSHPDNNIIYPFWGNYSHISGLLKSKTVFLQHGVTKDNVSDWLNGFNNPLAMLVCVSDNEKESFNNSNYGYSQDIIKTLGFPRFDSLRNEDKRQIVIMPSWRRQLNQLSACDFVKTKFYKEFNDLLTDEELCNFACERGYKLIFKPHRNLHKFLDTFIKRPDVSFDTNLKNYSETFRKSSLIITDYSSIAFDFAYLKKPIIYYQFDDNYHFDVKNSYFKYEVDGFGPVTHTKEELKQHIFKIIERNCEMEDIYKSRVDDFFKYCDKNNSKRVYDEIYNLDTYY